MSSDGQQLMLNVTSNVIMSDDIDNPPVNDVVSKINLIFEEDIDDDTLNDGIEIYHIDILGNKVREKCIIKLKENNESVVEISYSKGNNFPEGRIYKILVNSELRFQLGFSFEGNMEKYFATKKNYRHFKTEDKRTETVVIGDLYFGFGGTFLETDGQIEAVMSMLRDIRQSTMIKKLLIIENVFLPREVSDLIDEIRKERIVEVEYTSREKDLYLSKMICA